MAGVWKAVVCVVAAPFAGLAFMAGAILRVAVAVSEMTERAYLKGRGWE